MSLCDLASHHDFEIAKLCKIGKDIKQLKINSIKRYLHSECVLCIGEAVSSLCAYGHVH